MAKKRSILEVEQLDVRVTPSLLVGSLLGGAASGVTDAPPATDPPVVANPVAHPLAGQGYGTYTSPFLRPDNRPGYVLQGDAALAALGRVKISGAIVGVMPGQFGTATGTLTFTNDHGSVTIDLQGLPQRGFGGVPFDWQYKVSAATGDYANIQDQGALRLILKPTPTPVAATGAIASPQGVFALIIAGGSKVELPPPPLPPQVRSGVAGVALVGPISSVTPLGLLSVKPLPGAVITFQDANGVEVARTVADANGKFQIALKPGKYLLVPLPPAGQTLPKGIPQTIVVEDGKVTFVTVRYDSGDPPPTAESGVEGVALVGSVSPLASAIGVKPLPGAVITFQDANGVEVARTVADANGKSHLALKPGKYLLVPLPHQPGQTLQGIPQTVVVEDGKVTFVTVRYDLIAPAISPPTAQSGVEGVALIGPISPVDYVGVPNVAPLPGAVITIQDATGVEVARTVADANGKFHLALAPGKYLLVPLPPLPGARLPRGASQTIVVEDGKFTFVTVNYDSGIR